MPPWPAPPDCAARVYSFSGHALAREKRSGAKLSFARRARFAKRRRFSNGPGKWNTHGRRSLAGRIREARRFAELKESVFIILTKTKGS